MSHPPTPRKIILGVLLSLPLSMLIWWLALPAIILPALSFLSGSMLGIYFSSYAVAINLIPDGTWEITTNLLLEPRPYTRTLQTFMSIEYITLALPLLWSCCFGFYNKHLARNLLLGSLGVFLLINLGVFLEGISLLHRVMAMDNVINQYLGPNNIKPIEPISSLSLSLSKALTYALRQFTTFVAPPAWCYWANKAVIHAMLKNLKSAQTNTIERC